jgi:hypothetical protein
MIGSLNFLWCCTARDHVGGNEIVIDSPGRMLDTVPDWFNRKNDFSELLDKDEVSEQELAALCYSNKNFFNEDLANQTLPHGSGDVQIVSMNVSENTLLPNTAISSHLSSHHQSTQNLISGGHDEKLESDALFDFTFNGANWMSKREEALFEFTFNGANWANKNAARDVPAEDRDDLNLQGEPLHIDRLRRDSSGSRNADPTAGPNRKFIAAAVDQPGEGGNCLLKALTGLLEFFRHMFIGFMNPSTASQTIPAEALHHSSSIRRSSTLPPDRHVDGVADTDTRIFLDRLPDIRSKEFKELLGAILANPAEYDASEILALKEHYYSQSVAAIAYYENTIDPYSINKHLDTRQRESVIESYEKGLAERRKTRADLAKL